MHSQPMDSPENPIPNLHIGIGTLARGKKKTAIGSFLCEITTPSHTGNKKVILLIEKTIYSPFE